MGKRFYGTHSDKLTARRLANNGARSYRRGVCWTPSKDEYCSFDVNTNLWTCFAKAHHHEGSCGTWEIHHQGTGTPWQLGYSCDDMGNCTPTIGFPLADQEEIITTSEEEYTDATPEDYIVD
jgi:hypothetical protein